MRKIYVSLLTVLFFLFTSLISNAQLSGTKSIPGDYATITAAVTDLNVQGVGGGGVIFNVSAGYTETLSGKIVMTATGTAANPIVFRKNGAGANPVLTSYTGTVATPSVVSDGFWVLAGSDYVTIEGIDLLENAANTTTTTVMEFGFGLFKFSATDGSQNNTIKNCTITLNRVSNTAWSAPGHNGTTGIAVLNGLYTATGALTVTSAAGSNSFNKFYSNTIQNCNAGIVFVGFTATTGMGPNPDPSTFFGDLSNDVGGTTPGTGNTILNFGGAASPTNPATGIFVNNQWSFNCSYNTINNNNGSGVNHASTLRGIFLNASSTSASANCNNNNITIHGGATTSQVTFIENSFGSTAAGNTININDNIATGDYLTATSGTFYGFYNTASPATINMNGNTVNGITYSGSGLAGSGAIYPIYNTGTPTTINISNNTVNSISRTGTTGGTTIGIFVNGGSNQTVKKNTVSNMAIDGTGTSSVMYGIQTTTGTIVVDSNTVFSIACTKTTGTGALYGIYNVASPTNENFNYNKIYNITHAGTGTTYGLFTNTVTGVRTVSYNEVYGVSSGGTTVAGIAQTTSSPNIFKNKIYNIQSTSTAAPIVSGLVLTSLGTNGVANIHNNLIADIKAPSAGNATAAAPTVRGINLTTTTASSSVNVYYNTIHLEASSTGANFGSAGVFATVSATATTSALTLRNNIVVNKSTPGGVGLSVAYQRSGTALNNFTNSSNNNLYYAGTPGSSNLIFYDGTNSYSDIAAYKTYVSSLPADQNSETENVPFQSTLGSSPDFLKFSTSIFTKVEGSAENITGYTDDFAGTIRQGNPGYSGTGTRPDMGAWELNGVIASCSGTPGASNTISSASPACVGQNISLTLSQSYTGVSYQWQSSTDNITYNNIVGANGTSYVTIAPSVTTWYQCIISCLGNNTISTPVQVIINPPLVGAYSINSGFATGGTNFTNFADAVTALVCRGVQGAVVFNVEAGTSYAEQVIIPAISGASSSNTITFSGNGAALNYTSTATAERAVIKLNGADHIIIDSLVITAGGSATTEYGYGVQLVNNADSNTVKRCTITSTSTPATAGSTNFAGVVINAATATSATGTGDSQCDYNTISNNYIIGGYVGISAVANGSTSVINNNKALNNIITDFYEYGIYFNGHNNGLIEGNDVSRPTRASVTTFRGISLNGISSNTIVSKNKIYNPFGGASSNTSAAFGIYVNACRPTAGNENIISNNIIYNFVSGAGNPNHNGVLVVTSDHAKFYNNSILLDDAAATCTTCGTRGFYMQTAPFTGLEFKNNIVKISRGGTGPKQAIYFEGSGVVFTSNYNDYYMESGGGTVQLGFVNNVGYSDLATWQATGQDANSLSIDPSFISNTDLHLQGSSPVDDKGTPVATVTTDIDGQTRSLVTPDIGADEIPLSAGLDMKAALLVSPSVTQGCYNTETIVVRIKNNSTLPIDFSINPVTVTVNVTGAATANLSAVINSGILAPEGTQDVTMTTPAATLNMSAPGAYIFNASTSVTGDVNALNNAMSSETRIKVALTAGSITVSPSTYCGTSGAPTLTASGADGYTLLQWQQSTTSGSGFTDIPGANSLVHTVASPIPQTMYYRLVASCGAGSQPSAEGSAIFSNPQVLTSTPASRCGPGTVQLAATTTPGNTLFWYDGPSTPLPIGTGTSFTTPSINATTTFYAAASTSNNPTSINAVGAGATTSATYPNPFYSLWSNTHNQYLIPGSELSSAGLVAGNISAVGFDVTVAGTLPMIDLSIKIGTTTATDMSSFVSSAFTTVYTNASLMPVGGVNTLVFSTPFYWDGSSSLVIEICHGNPSSTATMSRTMKVDNTAYISTIHTHTSAAQGAAAQCGNLTTNLTTYSIRPQFIFTVTPGCVGVRTPVVATITTPPSISASATNPTICEGTSTQLNVSSANGGYTYVWNPGAIAGANPTVSPTATTAYTVTATDNSGGPSNGCVNTALVNVTVNAAPSPVVVTPGAGSFCTGAPAQLLTATGGTETKQLNFGTQASQNLASTTSTGYPAPYTVYYGGQRMQMLITAAELNAAGYSAGSEFTGIQFPVVSLGSNWGGTLTSCQNFQVSIGQTSLTSISAFQTGLTQVVSPANFTPTVGYNNLHSFSSTFVWDGTSNIILETTFSNAITGGTNDLVSQYYSPTAFQSTIVYRVDGVAAATVASATTVSFSYSARPDFKLNGTKTSPITWSPLTNLFTDAAATIPYTGGATYTVYALPLSNQTYTATATNTFTCISSGTSTVTIVPPPSATIAYSGSPYCGNAGTATVTRTGSVGGSYSSTAGLTINSSTGDVDLGASTPGTYTVTYTIAAGNGCPQFQTTASITIVAPPSATISYPGSPFCTGGGTASVTFSGTSGGTYSSTAGLAINSTTGAIDLAASTVGTYTVTYTIAAGACPQYQTTAPVTISNSPSATISYAGSPYCSNGSTATVTHTGSTGGTYSSTAGLSIDAGTGAVNIATSTPGTYTVTYAIAAAGGCSAFQTTTSITINVLPSATISYAGTPYCGNAGSATVTHSGTAGGTYSSTAGLSINSSTGAVNLGTSTPGTYTVTYTIAAGSGCPQVQTTTSITILAAQSATISYAGSPYCANAGTATVTRTGSAGGTYSSTAGLSIDASTGAVTLGTSTPGTYTVTYTIAPSGGCPQFQATTSITITATPNATISYAGTPYCSNSGTATVTHSGTAGGTYTSAGGLSINSSTGAINLSASTAGSYTVTYTVAAAGGCTVYQTTAPVTITAAPAATISYAGTPYCGNAGTATVTRTGTAGGTYTSTAGLSINASTGAVNLSGSTPGTYTVTYTVAAANGCAQLQVTAPIVVTPAPAATISYAGSPYCSNVGTANVTLIGTTGGTYSSTPGLSINASTGAVNLATSTAGNYTVTYTIAAANGCGQVQTTASITITSAPVATISYAGSPFCITGGTINVTQTGTTGGVYSSTAGLTLNPGTGAITLGSSAAGNYTVTYTIAGAGGCAQLQATTSVTIAGAGTWLGTISSDWNNAANWCGGLPTSAVDVTIPSVAPNMPNLSAGNGAVRSIAISNGASVTIGAGGVLDLYGSITGAGTFTATAGSVSFRGSNPQTVPAFTATNVTMNGGGGVTPGGNTTVTGNLLLVNGNITIGNNNITLNNTSVGSVSSHIITNGTGNVIVSNLAASQVRSIPVAIDATSYNPVILTANGGHTTDNLTVRVQSGVYENGVSGVTFTTHVANRMWIINESTPGGSNVNVSLQWAASQELTSFDRTKCYVMQHNGTAWVQGTGSAATGTDPYTQTKLNVTSFSPFAVQTEPIPRPITGIYPNPVRTYMYVVTDLLSTGPVVFSVFDSRGSLVYKRTETLTVGLHQTRLELGHLSSGVYTIRVTTRLNDKFLAQKFVKVN
jgi:hypothetical protein